MAKYTFTCQHYTYLNTSTDKITYELESDTLNDVLEGFQNFLKGSGFVFNGTLDVVPFETADYDELIVSSQHEDRI